MILLDTNVCIAAIRDERRVTSRMAQYQGRLYLPFVVAAELQFGLEKLERLGQPAQTAKRRMERFLSIVDGVLFGSDGLLRAYARLRAELEIAGTPIGPNGLWIAAQALAEGATLVTANIREFEHVSGLRLENWLKR
ncbi:MAG: PIN domain-containing protein [Gammaproteobacteria bacterium]